MHSPETTVCVTILSGVLVLALTVGFFIINIIRYQRSKLILYYDKLHTEIQSLENERMRIAQDLHDELGSMLSAIKLKLHCLEPERQDNMLIAAQSGRYIDEAMNKLKRISLNMTPRILERSGLAVALDELLHMQLSSTGISVHTHYAINLQDSATGIHIYRIVQEMVNNSIKHAHAQVINISIELKENHIHLHVQDDGTGFDKKAVLKNNSGQGLHNIMSRVDIVNGKMYLTTSPGNGTDYLIKIPVNNGNI